MKKKIIISINISTRCQFSNSSVETMLFVFAGNTNHPASSLHSPPQVLRQKKTTEFRVNVSPQRSARFRFRRSMGFFFLPPPWHNKHTTMPAFSLRKGHRNLDLKDVEDISCSRPVVLAQCGI